MERPKWIPKWLSISLIIVVAFIAWMLMGSENNYMHSKKLMDEINDLKAEIKAKQDSALYYEKKVQELHTDPETLERIAREQYGMRRANEEIYVTEK
ncbi:MAG: septum formation initiator family protein [Muribaculaceae bacterium]|nr:septum formation initiator family protein [Muribaculaceae bacterium]